MERIPEPELMDSEEQALAYARADFSEPHNRFVALFRETFPDKAMEGRVLDLGCGPADVSIRFALAFPRCLIDGIDAGPNMLALGRESIRRQGLEERIRLVEGHLPEDRPPEDRYEAIISNSLLHHLADPQVLWDAVRRHAAPGAPVFIMDLARPSSTAALDDLVTRYVEDEPEILRKDFRNSLLASYRPEEVRAQIDEAGLGQLAVTRLGDRHLVIAGQTHS